MTIVDADTVQPTNINRQLPAMHSTLGKTKAEVLAARYKDINPDIELKVLPVYLKDENIPELLDAGKYDFIVDAIDTISPKCYLIFEAMKRRINGGRGEKRYHAGSLCRPLGYLPLRTKQSCSETFAEDGNETEAPGSIQYRTG